MSGSQTDEEWFTADEFTDEDKQQLLNTGQLSNRSHRSRTSKVIPTKQSIEPRAHDKHKERERSHQGEDYQFRFLGEASWPSSVEEDLPILRDLGYKIDFSPAGKLGEGSYGVVYRGSSSSGQPFAVKIVDFKLDPVTEQRLSTPASGDPDRDREMTATEKFIVTNTDDPNVVSVLAIVNMGEPKVHAFRGAPEITFISTPRIYFFMELADGGALNQWLQRNRKMAPSLRISILRQLFRGMKYLHDHHIAHGDVHDGNVLMFGRWTAKWTDFGSGFVSEKGRQYAFKQPISQDTWNDVLRRDLLGMASIFQKVLSSRKECPNEKIAETVVLDQLKRMSDQIWRDRLNDINQLYANFKFALDDRR